MTSETFAVLWAVGEGGEVHLTIRRVSECAAPTAGGGEENSALRFGCGFGLGCGGGCGRFVFIAEQRTTEAKVVVGSECVSCDTCCESVCTEALAEDGGGCAGSSGGIRLNC
jgi:hypothetical protein